ncbi:MAG: hypothetical protein A4E72_01427 [Syntrophus sp. PtaU1.Bin208]|nr:MAG: hypothetical protein A4E72_01427 [Syntrophus sp. PtaU1.Bin208]
MKKIWTFAARLSALTLIALFSPLFRVYAAPVEATLFPDFAQMMEVSQVSAHFEGRGRGTVQLILPGRVQPEDLKIFLDDDPDLKITNLSWRTLPTRGSTQNDAQAKQLRNITEERKRLAAVIKGLETEIAFWQSQTKAKTKTLKDAMNLSAAISRNTKKAWQEKMTLEGECEKLDLRIKNLSEELKKTSAEDNAERQVTLSLTGLKPEKKNLSLKYAYTLSNCGWLPLYRLEGRFLAGRVDFSWDAEVWQNSTQDWNGVKLSLASQPVVASTLTTREKSPEWKIEAPKTGKRKNSGKGEQAESTSIPAHNPVAPFKRFLGQRSLPKGQKQILSVDNATWPATFSHFLRPFSQRSSIIGAAVISPLPLQIPKNSALFLLDGVLVGRYDFDFYGQEKNLFFGIDPSISAEIKMLSKPQDVPVVEGEKQVWDWRWQTVIKNEGRREVTVRIEEPVPQIKDRRIKSEVRGEPEVLLDGSGIGSRNLELKPGVVRSLETSVHIEAPRDLPVEMNWVP